MVKAKAVKAEACGWAGDDELYRRYHDEEWGVPCRDAGELFELIILEGQQAGLSWLTILRRRAHFRRAFLDFNPKRLAALTDAGIAELLTDPGIIRHPGKVAALRNNARAYLELEQRTGAVEYLWSFVGGAPLINRWLTWTQIPTQTTESQAMAKSLRKLGFQFVGPTICYALMQSAGMVNDHLLGCPRHRECLDPGTRRCVVE